MAGRKSLRKELIELVNERSASDVEIVDRYVQLATTSKQLGADIRKNGTTLTVVNNGNTYLKTNPAIAELTRVSKELNNLKVFFDEKRKAKTSAHEIDESEFL
ncbi:MAG: P27 family phage terminase small subunit [Streptococcaceae bacterium]|nr:P27 family phage terminase small subunit [Streptococcaceae bacterium]